MRCNESANVQTVFLNEEQTKKHTDVTCLFSTLSRAWRGLHFQRTSDWLTAFYTLFTVGSSSWFGFVTTVIEQFSIPILSKVTGKQLLWFWFYYSLLLLQHSAENRSEEVI